MRKAVLLRPDDDVAVALTDLEQGEVIAVGDNEVRCLAAIPFAHKIAVRGIPKGERVRKYGAPIGVATQDIQKGEHVHVHNLRGERGREVNL